MPETTLEYARKWNLVALRLGIAYSKAYNSQKETLDTIQKAVAATGRRRGDDELHSRLLTGGMWGDRQPLCSQVYERGELSVLRMPRTTRFTIRC